MPLPVFSRRTDNVDNVMAADINSLQAEIEKMAYGIPIASYTSFWSLSSNATLDDTNYSPVLGFSATTTGLSVTLPAPTPNSHAFYLMNTGTNPWTLKNNDGSTMAVLPQYGAVLVWPAQSANRWMMIMPSDAVIDDTLAPSSAYGTLIDLLGMFGNILKTMAGVSSWVSAAKKLNVVQYVFTCSGTTVAASNTAYIVNGGTVSGLGSARIPLDRDITFTKLIVRTNTAQSSTGSLVFTLQKVSGDTALVVTVAASAAAGTYSATGNILINAGDAIDIKVVNNATATSAGISSVVLLGDL
jgi:hypothetical protein